MSASARRTVYVLGAGFSHDAGCPLQGQILSQILSFDVRKLGVLDTPFDITSYFEYSRTHLVNFLTETFAAGTTPPLEDVFTLLDHTIDSRGTCKHRTWQQLEETRREMNRAILFLFHWAATNNSPGRTFYRLMAVEFLKQRVRAGQDGDPFSIVSLNWDSLLEDDIYWGIRQINATDSVDIDYCCYTTPLDKSSPHRPSLIQKATGLYNIKIMKLHGSANWLICPNCRRLFTGVGEASTVWDLYIKDRACPACSYNAGAKGSDKQPVHPALEPFFISPTFLKKFDNPHIQMTWHNAFLDLSEANEVVFIGYSLPDADYHLRTLLRRSISDDAHITVVLADDDDPRKRRRGQHFTASDRYRAFFGSHRVALDFSGVRGHFARTLGRQPIGGALATLRRMLRSRQEC